MAGDRTVKVTLSAQVQGYIDGMQKAAQATKEVGSESEKLAQQREAFNMVGVSALAFGAAAAAGVGLAVSKFADFDAAMSNVQAATGESEHGMERLSEAALAAGARTVFSAEEAANAIEELAKAGVSTADILDGALDGALDLAAAGGLGVAEAAGIAATALKTFNLEGSEMSHVADLLAAGAGKAMGDVTDLSGALNQSALVANATGLSIEETTATLAAFASQGLLGSDAGTSFKSMLQSLTPSSAAARKTMDELGISAYDAQGNFIGMAEFAGVLQNGLKGLSSEQQQATMKTIFGSDAVRAATVLYNEGADGINDWIDAVDDQGYAAEQAAARLDNLKGDIEALGGALDTALIKTGSGANDVLRGMVQWLTDAVDAYNALPAELQGVTLGIGILTAGIGLLGGAAFLSISALARMKESLIVLGITSAGVRTALMSTMRFILGPWGAALGVAGIAVATFNAFMDGSKVSAETLESALRQGASALTVMQEAATKNEQGLAQMFVDVSQHAENLAPLLDKAATSGRGFFSSMSFNEQGMLSNLTEFGTVLGGLASSNLPAASKQFVEFTEQAELNKDQISTLLGEMPAFKNALLDVAEAEGLATDDATLLKIALGEVGPASQAGADAARDHADALAQMEGKAGSTEGAVDDLSDAITGFGKVELDVREANRQLESAFDDLAASVKENGNTLDITTEKGRANEAALDDIAKATLDATAATLQQTGSQTEANAKMAEGRQKLIDSLAQFGITGKAAEDYADKLGLIPENIDTAIKLQTAQASKDLQAWLNKAPKVLTIQGQIDWANAQASPSVAQRLLRPSADGNIFAYSDGGFESGIYSGGAPIHKFAEPETRWEAYISGKPGQEDRNRRILMDAAGRLGMNGMGGTTVNVTVNAAPGMDAEQVAERAVAKLRGQL